MSRRNYGTTFDVDLIRLLPGGSWISSQFLKKSPNGIIGLPLDQQLGHSGAWGRVTFSETRGCAGMGHKRSRVATIFPVCYEDDIKALSTGVFREQGARQHPWSRCLPSLPWNCYLLETLIPHLKNGTSLKVVLTE